jgi:CheY-like chemotaxis protein
VVDDRFAALGRRPYILIVDDSDTARGLVQMVLEGQQFEVAVACDGREALDYVARRVPDLIVTDGLMPHVDGPTLVRRLRENPDTSHIPVIALTSGEPREWLGTADGPEPDAVLRKSAQVTPLLDCVNQLLAKVSRGA